MGYTFLEFMKRIGIFIICAQSVMHFVAGKSYEKYVKLLIGIMVLAQFVVPIRALLLGNDNAEIWNSIEVFQKEMEIAVDSADINYDEAQLSESLQEEIKEKLEGTANQYHYTIKETIVSEDPPKLYIVLASYSESRTDSMKINIEKIDLNLDKDESLMDHQETEIIDINIKEAMINDFSVCLGTDKTYIEISIE